MRPIQILMDDKLIKEVDREAKRRRSDRSKLIREALAKMLKEARTRALEEQHRRAYERFPQQWEEYGPWQKIQAWPED